jgi:hypothetical protein
LSAAFIVAPPSVAVTTMVVTVVHEHMHQRTRQQEREGQDAQHMGAVFYEQEKSTNRYDKEERNAAA